MTVSASASLLTKNDTELSSKVIFFIHVIYFNSAHEKINELKANRTKTFSDLQIPAGTAKIQISHGGKPKATVIKKDSNTVELIVESPAFTTISACDVKGDKISDLVSENEPFHFSVEINIEEISMMKVTSNAMQAAKTPSSKVDLKIPLTPNYVEFFEIKNII